MQLSGWYPRVWLGLAAVPVLVPELTLVLLRVPVLGARPLLELLRPGLLRPAVLRWPVRSGGVWSVE